MIKAILFDMDGVIYDSMGANALAWHEAMSSVGAKSTLEDFYLFEGRTGSAIIDILFERSFGRKATENEKKEIYQTKVNLFDKMQPDGAKPMDGIKEVLAIVKETGLIPVIVTGSGQQSMFDRLEQHFPAVYDKEKIVTAYDVKHGKPHPEPYLTGMEKAGVTPEEAIVVENAPLGVKAAKAAGIFTIAVNTGPLANRKLLEAGADLVFPSMHKLAGELKRIVAEIPLKQ
ncbi:HAD family hydrolase [Phocaeicola dorei]|uniref:HAD family hydrolase n=1 Tax=Bacteroides ovatus TaxID=28116 RepID=UPI0002D8EAC1|nr:HAD-IA family hydrolase [Bacteroides ovatus]TDA83855.1 HAD family hydrolase [Phocaeicola dorei]TDA91380.1 HAD family hydrolase [Phocaeicola dorei]